ncbi:MAG: nitroreductase family protein [Solirubrobacterales bacterium]
MDTQLAIASKRDRRTYADRAVPPDVERSILEAGRVTGSGRNRQARRFVVIDEGHETAVDLVTRPDNIRGATLVVAIVIPAGKPLGRFDAGRAAQNMMLAAWNQDVVSCPNAIADEEGINKLVGAAGDEEVAVLLSFGYSASGADPSRFSVEEWIEKADRVPFDQAVARA